MLSKYSIIMDAFQSLDTRIQMLKLDSVSR
jgi:hypothetical protein